jgi:hypothetical protein
VCAEMPPSSEAGLFFLVVCGSQGDPRVRSILQERYGITDMATVLCDTWACHGRRRQEWVRNKDQQ